MAFSLSFASVVAKTAIKNFNKFRKISSVSCVPLIQAGLSQSYA